MSETRDTDAAVIGRDDLPLTFEGEDLEFPSRADEFGTSPTAKHVDFDDSTGRARIDGTDFNLGAITKGVADGVTATAKAVAEVARASAPTSPPKSDDSPQPTKPKPETKPQTTPATPKPVRTAAASGGMVFAVAGLGVVAAGLLLALASRGSRRRGTL